MNPNEIHNLIAEAELADERADERASARAFRAARRRQVRRVRSARQVSTGLRRVEGVRR